MTDRSFYYETKSTSLSNLVALLSLWVLFVASLPLSFSPTWSSLLIFVICVSQPPVADHVVIFLVAFGAFVLYDPPCQDYNDYVGDDSWDSWDPANGA